MGGWRGILGFEYGIVLAPLGPDISGPELVAAVANAGGLGLLRAPDWESPDYVRDLIRKTRTLTDKPFGVGVVLAFPHKENINAILDEKVAVLQLYWGECTEELVLQAHQAGVKVVPQVGRVEEAKKAIDAGVDAIIVQGREAGGHVIGQIYTTAVLLATLRPPLPPREQKWRNLMEEISKISCDSYRSTVYENPEFLAYFHEATPQAELGFLNIGSRPTRRKSSGGIGQLRAIPWVFAWTQTRFVLPAWLGVGAGLKGVCEKGHTEEIKAMYKEWPFFQCTIDLIEMVLGKADINIAKRYDEVLVSDSRQQIGEELRRELLATEKYVLVVTGHEKLSENNRSLQRLIESRLPYLNPINMLQVEILKRLRRDDDNHKLRDALLITINGIAAGMRNTG